MRSPALVRFLPIAATCLGLALASPVSAQTLEEEMAETEETPPRASSSTSTTTSTEANDEQALYEERAGVETNSETDPTELRDRDYFFLGASARGVIVPGFIQDLFVRREEGLNSGGDPLNGGGGLMFNWRRNGFNVVAEAWYQGFGARGYYHGLDAADTEFEFIESSLGVVFGSFLFSWGIDVTNWFAVDIGFGLGFGGLVGDLYRTEATRASGTSQLQACSGPSTDAYCESPVETRGANGRLDSTRVHGGTYQHLGVANNGPNPFYFGDGGVPPIFFWLDLPRVGLRFKPIRQVQIRVDGGYNLYGFNFGGSIAYGF